MPDNNDDEFQIEVGYWDYHPTEPISMTLPELSWKADKYYLRIKDSDFQYNVRGPGDTFDITPRSTSNGERTRVHNS